MQRTSGEEGGPATAAARDLAAASRRARWMGPVFAGLAALLVPWTVYLAMTLPEHQTAAHYDLSWSGFDVGLVLALGGTAACAWRRSTWLPIVAAFTAAMLCVDAWFDVTTAPDGDELLAAVASAALLELPLAVVCLWLARNGQRIIERRISLRVRALRPRPTGGGRRGRPAPTPQQASAPSEESR